MTDGEEVSTGTGETVAPPAQPPGPQQGILVCSMVDTAPRYDCPGSLDVEHHCGLPFMHVDLHRCACGYEWGSQPMFNARRTEYHVARLLRPTRDELARRMLHAFFHQAELGYTDSGLQAYFRLSRHPGTVTRTRLRLERLGFVRRTDETLVTPWGGKAMVFKITPEGIEEHLALTGSSHR